MAVFWTSCGRRFPVRPDDLPGDVRFHDTGDDDFPAGLAGCVRVGCAIGDLGFASTGTASIAYVPGRPRRLHSQEMLERVTLPTS
jgi:hypothetical protein